MPIRLMCMDNVKDVPLEMFIQENGSIKVYRGRGFRMDGDIAKEKEDVL